MKGQILPSIFIIIMVSIMILGYVIYNSIYGIRYQQKIFKIKIIDETYNLINDIDYYIDLALKYSSDQSFRENAEKGGSFGSAPWICNGPNPLPYIISKKCLENYTNFYINTYLKKYSTTIIPLKIVVISNFSSTKYEMDVSKINSGAYDNGNYSINATGALIGLYGTKISVEHEINASKFIKNNRYWYLFRKFYEWAESDPLTPCICRHISCACSSLSSKSYCGSCRKYVTECGKNALEILQKKFDKYITCNFKILCCQQGRGPSCKMGGCETWTGTDCKKSCQHYCLLPSGKRVKYSLHNSLRLEHYNPYNYQSKLGATTYNCWADYWYEGRISVGYVFYCKDKKYFISAPQGPIPLTFSVKAYVYLKYPRACYYEVGCKCPKKYNSCRQCTPIGGACGSCHS